MNNPTFEAKYKTIEKQINEYLKYRTRSTRCAKFLIVEYFSFIVIVYFYSVLFIGDYPINPSYVLIAVFGLTILFNIYWSFRARMFKPSADDLAFFYTYNILDYVELYKTSNSTLGKIYVKKAVSNAKLLISLIQKNWLFGDFRLAFVVFNNGVSAILSGLDDIVMGLERRDERTILKIERILSQFASFLLVPTLDGFHELSTVLGNTEFNIHENNLFGRCRDFFSSHSIFKHFFIVTIILVLGLIPALLILSEGSGSIDNALIVFSAIFGPSIAVYISSVILKKT